MTRQRMILGVTAAVVVFAAGFGLGWAVDGTPTHWVGIFTSVGAIVAGAGVFFVWESVSETAKTRHATLAADVSRRWDEKDMRDSRELIRLKVAEQGRLAKDFVAGNEVNATAEQLAEYTCLQVVPNYLEDVVILLNLGALDQTFVEDSLGAILRDQWGMWREAADAWRKRAGRDPWPNFRSFSEEDGPGLTGRRKR
jgi:hypothetical protein